jgi:hypothetical protein
MASKIKNWREKTPRYEKTVIYQCFASQKLFGDWDDLSTAARKEFVTNGPIPCEGGGVPGEWCANCRFGEVVIDD